MPRPIKHVQIALKERSKQEIVHILLHLKINFYFAVNILQSQQENRPFNVCFLTVYSPNRRKLINILSKQNALFVKLKQLIHVVNTVL